MTPRATVPWQPERGRQSGAARVRRSERGGVGVVATVWL